MLLNKALDGGINFVDTADCYGDSEEKIGITLRGRRKEFYLSTKIDERDRIGVQKKLERCLRRLRTHWIDLVLFHDVRGSEYDRIFESGGLEALERAREEGKIREIGISIHHSLAMMRKVIESVAQVSLHYVLSNPHITCAIPGMREIHELNENLQVGRQPRKLTREEIKALMRWVGEAGKGFCRNCGYCLPCPEGIPIPDIFRFEGYYERYELKQWAKDQYRSLEVKADACSGCEQCVELCPYGVSIPERLKIAHRTLQ